MFKKKIVLVLAFIFLSATVTTNAQEAALEKGKEYTLAGIEVTGKVSYNEQTVITFTGACEYQPVPSRMVTPRCTSVLIASAILAYSCEKIKNCTD